MLTRLKVDGFKNLVDVDLRFGPYTCIAGANGSGKSNVFDVIAFLSALADSSFAEAIRGVRAVADEGSRLADLLHRSAAGTRDTLRFECEVLIPRTGVDEFGQSLRASGTSLRYVLELKARSGEPASGNPLELVGEELWRLSGCAAGESLSFASDPDPWLSSVLLPDVSDLPLIDCPKPGVISVHPDADPSDRGSVADAIAVGSSSRTVLSTITAKDNATAYLVRHEMRSWRRLALEVNAMRRPDSFDDPVQLGSDGSHMASTLNALVSSTDAGAPGGGDVLGQLSGRIMDVTGELRTVEVDVDRARESLRIVGKDKHGIAHDARSMSEGTLRFLALALLEFDSSSGLVCLEEPENGLHPSRIESAAWLLQGIALDTGFQDGEDNPLRQVIVSTHSPGIVRFSPADSVLMADVVDHFDSKLGGRTRTAHFRPLADSWRARAQPETRPVFITELLSYLGYVPVVEPEDVPENRVDRYADVRTSALTG